MIAIVGFVLFRLLNPAPASVCACAEAVSAPVVQQPLIVDTTGQPRVPPHHPVATECALSDTVCVREHNDRALLLAIWDRDVFVCEQSTTPETCKDSYAIIQDDKIEYPPITACTWIADISHHVATLFMPLTQQVKRTVARNGWTAHTYLGDCSKLPKGLSFQEMKR